MSNPHFVSGEWLAQHLDAPDVVVVDASWYLPNLNRNAKAEYAEGHIPGAVFFDIDGIADMVGALDEGYRASADFMAALDRHDLLEPFSMDVTLDNGASHRMVGYHLVHEERVRNLEPGVLAELHAAGHLEPIYMALASIGNLAKLVRRKSRRQAPAAHARNAAHA